MLSLAQIYDEMDQFRTSKGAGRKPGDYPNVSFSKLSIHGSIGVKTVLFKGESVGSQGDRYSTHLLFMGCEFSDVALKGFHKAMIGNTDDTTFFKTLSFDKQKVRVYCSCDDARHTMAWQLFKQGAWLVQPKKYTPVAGSNRPPRNPLDKALVCKHLHSLVSMLMRQGMIV